MKRLWLVLYVVACGKSVTAPVTPTYEVHITPSASFQYLSSKRYALTLRSVDSTSQTIQRLTAITTAPDQTKFIWESNKTWEYIFFGEKFPVPTLNCCSYSFQNIATTVLAPVMRMKGDSMKVSITALVHDTQWIGDTITVILK